MSEIKITYETLYEMLRNEKNREELQELSQTFYTDVHSYIKKNRKMLDDTLISGSSEEIKEEHIRQLRNIKSLTKELFERREKKILLLALNKARTNTETIEIETLLPEEREMYSELCVLLTHSRQNILDRLLAGSIPVLPERRAMPSSQSFSSPPAQERHAPQAEVPKGPEPNRSAPSTSIPSRSAPVSEQPQTSAPNPSMQTKPVQPPKQPSVPTNAPTQPSSASEKPDASGIDPVTLRFTGTVPKFLGKQLEVYGPFEENDVADLPNELAQVLLRKGKAEVVEN